MTLIEQIKEKTDIVQFIGSYIQLKPAGKNFKANCPFHKENTPSFMVSPDRQRWHCFGSCSEGGDVITFLMKYDNLEFHEALKILAEKAGIEIKKTSPQEQKQFGILYDIIEATKSFYKNELKNSKSALEYLAKRGLKAETIEEFEIGFAPADYDNQTVHLINLGFDVKDIERAGVCFKNDRGSYTDRLRGRIIFPITNHFGKTIGFSGRILPEYDTGETGKYINSPETLIFNKSKTLYGFGKTKSFIREAKQAAVMEGQMDFLMCWQDGMKNIVAVSGTALTGDHLTALKKQADNVVFCFDADEAGLKAAERAIDLASGLDLNVKLLVLDDFKDPADAVLAKPGFMAEAVKSAKPAMEFYFDRYLGRGEAGGEIDFSLFKKNLRVILEKIKKMASPVEQSHWLKFLAHLSKTDESVLRDEMERIKISSASPVLHNFPTAGIFPDKAGRRKLIADRLIALLSAKKEFAAPAAEFVDYFPAESRAMYENIINQKPIAEQKIADELAMLSMAPVDLSEKNAEKLEEEFEELLRELKLENLKEEAGRLKEALAVAEKNKDEQKISDCLKKFDEVSKIIQNYKV